MCRARVWTIANVNLCARERPLIPPRGSLASTRRSLFADSPIHASRTRDESIYRATNISIRVVCARVSAGLSIYLSCEEVSRPGPAERAVCHLWRPALCAALAVYTQCPVKIAFEPRTPLHRNLKSITILMVLIFSLSLSVVAISD